MNRRNFLKRLLAIPAAFVGLKVTEDKPDNPDEWVKVKFDWEKIIRGRNRIPYVEGQEFQSKEWQERYRKAYLEHREAMERDLLFGIKERDKQSDDFWKMFT